MISAQFQFLAAPSKEGASIFRHLFCLSYAPYIFHQIKIHGSPNHTLGIGVPGMCKDLFGQSQFQGHSFIKDNDPAAQLLCQAQVVCNDQKCRMALPVDAPDQIDERLSGFGIQGTGGFIQIYQFRGQRQCIGQ